MGIQKLKLPKKKQHIYLLDTNSNEFVDITNILVKYVKVWYGFSLDWTPDQEQFVVVKHEGQEYEFENFLDFIGFDGELKERVSIETTGEIPALIQYATLSPDGKKAVLTQGVIGHDNQTKYPGSAILVYDFESKKTTQLTTYEDHCIPREWSPDSQQIAVTCSFSINYVEMVSGPSTVKILDIENPDQPSSLIGFSPCEYPTWSPDGKQIAFICEKEFDKDGLFILNTENYAINEVFLGNPANFSFPVWSPDGERIIYAAGPDREHRKIYSIRPDGSDKHALTSEEGSFGIVAVYPIP